MTVMQSMTLMRRFASVAAWLAFATMPCLAQSADSAWASRDFGRARRLYLERLAADSTDATALFRLALIDTWTGRPARSLAYLDRLLRMAPADLDAQAARARALAAAGRFDLGLAQAESMLEQNPANVLALQTRARFALWNGEIGLAEALVLRALAADPDNGETRIALSQVLRRQGRFDDAAEGIAPARAKAPNDADVRDEADRVAQLIRPRVRSVVGYEADSDDNAVLTWHLAGAAPARRGLQLRADAYVRDASLEGSSPRSITARGAVATASFATGGWLVETSAGATTSVDADAATLPALGLLLVTPRRTRMTASLSLARVPWDYTAPMTENRVVVDEARLGLDWQIERRWSTALTIGIARFDVRRQDASNRRWTAQGVLTRSLSDRLSFGLGVRGFGFNRDLNGGYFDPDFYGLADARLALRLGTARWIFDADLAPGVQQAGRTAEPQAALHAAAELSYSFRPGRRIGVRTVWANTGINQLSPGARSSYHYGAATLTVGWWF
jgi:hypothetical protein